MLIYAVVRRSLCEDDMYMKYYLNEDKALNDANERNIHMSERCWTNGIEYEVDTIIVEE